MRRLTTVGLLAGVPVLVLLAVLFFGTAHQAAADTPPAPKVATPAPTPVPAHASTAPAVDNSACTGCHRSATREMKISGGETLSLFVNPDTFTQSVHGQQGVACVDCHTTISGYPHPQFSAPDVRQVTLNLNETCRNCHASEFDKSQDSVHQKALASGEREAAVCTDCHGAHEVQKDQNQTHAAVAATSANCHSTVYAKYKDSIHGVALLQNNPDVPGCTDCHGVHNIPDPTTASFRLESPTQMCGSCHTDKERMDKYGISTQVLNTYVSDFHGTTVQMFAKQSPDQQTNKPVCFDCHGVHDISAVNDPQKGLELKENLLTTCQKCHPDATANFPTSWMSHYIPSPTRSPLVWAVDLFYKIFIPTVLGGMAVLVFLDAGRRVRNRLG